MYIPSRLVKEQYLRSCDELTGNRKPSFLPTRYALANGRTNNGVGLILQSKRRQELVNATTSFMTRDWA